MKLPCIFVVIPSWNLKDDLIACVKSLFDSSIIYQLRIVVVDNASTDGTVEALHQEFGRMVEVISCEENLGFAYAVNTGARFALQAGADFILILNNDTVVDTQMVERLAKSLNQDPDVGIVGPIVYYFEPADRVWWIGDRQLFGPPLTWKVSPSRLGSTPFRVSYVTGCAMLVKREVFESIGWFDEDYQMYFEDADFCQRARVAGFEILVVPQAKMWHKVSSSTRKAVPKRICYQWRSRVIFLNRHSPYVFLVLSNFYIWARLGVEMGQSLVQGNTDLSKAALRGTLRGYIFLWREAL